MTTFCIKLTTKNVDSGLLWAKIGRDNLNLTKVNDTLWVHGTMPDDTFLNIVDECLNVSKLSIEVRR